MRKKKTVFIILILFCITVFLLPIELPYSFRATGKIYPLRQWKLTRGENNNFLTNETNLLTGKVKQLTQFKFEENDIGSYRSFDLPKGAKCIKKWDTLACFYSYSLDEKVKNLENELYEKNLLLRKALSGEKKAIVQQLSADLEETQNEVMLSERDFDRTQILFRDSIVSRAEYDMAFYRLKMLNSKQKEAEFALEASLTGMKSEEIDWIQGVIKCVEEQIVIAEKQKEELCLRAPFSGNLSYAGEEGQFLLLENMDSLVLTIPIRFRDDQFVRIGHKINFVPQGQDKEYTATIIRKEDGVYFIQNEQITFVKAIVENLPVELKAGLLVSGKFECDSVPLYEYLGRSLEVFLD